MKTKMHSPFGQELKYWRRLQGMSQLALAVEAGVSPRHLSFIETGRSRPGRDLVLRLSESLNIPTREQNDMMKAAGLSPIFSERELSDTDLRPYRQIITRILSQHEPYPAFVFDRWWNIVDLNRTTALYYPQFAQIGVNAIDVFVSNEPPHIENREEVGRNLLGRIRSDWAKSGHDERLMTLLKKLEDSLNDASKAEDFKDSQSPVIATRFQIGDTVVSTIGTIMRFDTARDVTLDELRIELHFPADSASAAFFQQFSGEGV